jgi:hypothetical protein
VRVTLLKAVVLFEIAVPYAQILGVFVLAAIAITLSLFAVNSNVFLCIAV